MMKRLIIAATCITALASFGFKKTLTGLWEYRGGVYNGKPALASKDYILRRKYDDSHYQGFFIEPGQTQEVYEKGDYQLSQDTCLETQTYSKMPSKTIGVALHYHYQVAKDTLTFTGTLPNGTIVKEYWKKVR